MAKYNIPSGFKIAQTRDRAGNDAFTGFVDSAQGVYAPRKGALCRGSSMDIVIAKLNTPEVRAKVTKASVANAPAIKPATKSTKASARHAELESLD